MHISMVPAIILIQAFVLVQSQPKWTDYRSPKAIAIAGAGIQNNPPICKEAGLTCGSDCVSVYLCKDLEHGWRPVLAETCKNGQTCSGGKCSSVPSHECSSGAKFPFVCKSIDGVYPDPADCKKKHYCVPCVKGGNLTHIEASCGKQFAYNPRTTYCDVSLSNDECQDKNYLVPICEKPAQTGIVPGNPTMYYICLPYSANQNILYPFLYNCPNGKIYTENYTCEEKSSL